MIQTSFYTEMLLLHCCVRKNNLIMSYILCRTLTCNRVFLHCYIRVLQSHSVTCLRVEVCLHSKLTP